MIDKIRSSNEYLKGLVLVAVGIILWLISIYIYRINITTFEELLLIPFVIGMICAYHGVRTVYKKWAKT